MNTFAFEPSPCIPFRDMEALARCRAIQRGEIERHPNPNLKIRVVPDAEIAFIWATNMFQRITAAADEGSKVALIRMALS